MKLIDHVLHIRSLIQQAIDNRFPVWDWKHRRKKNFRKILQ